MVNFSKPFLAKPSASHHQRLTMRSLTTTMRIYCDNSSIHGLRYISDPRKPISERIFWSIVCTTAIGATYILLSANMYSYEHNAVSFTADTGFLHWNTTFPALTVCEKDTHEKISEAAEKLYGPDRNLNIEIFVRDVAFFDGSCWTCNSLCMQNLNCSGDLNLITKTTRQTCDELIGGCVLNGKSFGCCTEFLPLDTEIGPCFSINSMNTMAKTGSSDLNFQFNRETGPGILTFTTENDLYIFLHSTDDVPMINHPKLEKAVLYKGSEFHWQFSVREIVNDPLLKQLSQSQRGCRFSEEKHLKSYKVYSYSGCMVDCRVVAQHQFCGCTNHFTPRINGISTCGLSGLRCLIEHWEQLRKLKCNCPPSCTEPEYTILSKKVINDHKTGSGKSEISRKITVSMAELPAIRFKRIVVRTMLDLVVSMGGTIGLFLGASILSSVEILYFLLLRRTPN